MGALLGRRLLKVVPAGQAALAGSSAPLPGVPAVLDADAFRNLGRTLVWRRVDTPLLVLGPRQGLDAVDERRCAEDGVAVVRRRSGGGAVLLRPDDHLWADLWIPAGDPLFDADVLAACVRVGGWWQAALAALGAPDLALYRRRAVEGPGAELCCFAGLGPGEVTARGRKIVGLSQWRCRQGALFQCAVYRRFEPAALGRLLALDEARRIALVGAWEGRASGLGGLVGPTSAHPRGSDALGRLAAAFEGDLPDALSWDRRQTMTGPA